MACPATDLAEGTPMPASDSATESGGYPGCRAVGLRVRSRCEAGFRDRADPDAAQIPVTYSTGRERAARTAAAASSGCREGGVSGDLFPSRRFRASRDAGIGLEMTLMLLALFNLLKEREKKKYIYKVQEALGSRPEMAP